MPSQDVQGLIGQETIELDAPIEEVFAFLADIETGPTWQDGLARVTVRERDSGGHPTIVDTLTDAKVRTITSRLRFGFEEPTRISWSQEKGDLKHLEGSWTLEAIDVARTQVTYKLEIDPGRVLGMLIRGPVESQLRERLIAARTSELKRAVLRRRGV